MSKSYLIVRHTVEDFATWKPVYDGHVKVRDEAGLKEIYLLRNIENQNDVTMLFEAQDLEKAKAFVESADTHDKMKESLVVGVPEIYFLR